MTNIISFPSASDVKLARETESEIVIGAANNTPAIPALPEGVEGFEVEKHPISGPYGVIESKKGIFVDGKCINVVSPNYDVHQPMEVLNTFYNVAESTGLQVNRILTNKNNGGILISAKYDDLAIMGEEHDVNLTFYTSHCGRYKTFLTLDLLRMACFNQVPCLYKNKDRHLFAEKHYKNALDISTIGKLLEHIPESVRTYNEQAELMQQKTMSFDDFATLWADHYKQDTNAKKFDDKIAKLRDTYYNATGQRIITGENAYKAYQAITFENTHGGRNTKNKNENVLTKNSDDSLKFMAKLLAA